MTRATWSMLLGVFGCAAPERLPPPIDYDPVEHSTESSTGGALAPKPDVAAVQPCNAVDLLFVIDNSGSMGDEQDQLVASFPGFIAGIEQLLGDADYHVGVITTDENLFNEGGCQRLGALTTRTGGDGSSDAQCGPFAEHHAFMTPVDDLARTFACTGRVGVEGSGIERPMDATIAALTGEGVGACNREFLRRDALLVLTIITDEDDAADSRGDPSSWYDSIVAVKHDDAQRVVVLSLVGVPRPNACPPGPPDLAGAEVATRLLEFTEMFEYGSSGDVCDDDYAAAFDAALQRIAAACDVATPVG
ncbi:MAG: hypothetical protein IPK74_33120 [Deltaproteobacteria bacterium]|nr:hypothetical protein [Deltaproteobacteria bacterium]